MRRLVIRAVFSAAAAALILAQLRLATELLAWEGLLLILLVWQLFEVPGDNDSLAPRLFGSAPSHVTRLPRSVSSIELSMIDALSGYLSPERRVRPMLRRLASHRLRRRGVAIESSRAMERLGEENWRWLMSSSDEAPDPARIEDLVTQLEAL